MKLVPSRFVPGLVAAAIAASACFAVATVVEAQTPPPKAPDARPMRGPDEHGPGMHHLREVERFKASLALTAQQTAIWDKAVAAMKPPANMREQMKARHDKLEAILNDPNFDPRKLATEMDAAAAERRTHMTSIRDAWIAVYDSLNPMQRGQAREFLRERMSHGHGEMMRERGEWMHREGRGPMPPMPPMTPGAPQTPPAR